MKRIQVPGVRKVILGIALLCSVSAAVWVSHSDETVVEPAVSATERGPATRNRAEPESLPVNPVMQSTAERAALTSLDFAVRNAAIVEHDPFGPFAILVPPKPVAPFVVVPASAVVVAEPVAPPLPFQYAGKFIETGNAGVARAGNAGKSAHKAKQLVYLIRGDETFAVSPGEKIDENYQFEGFDGDNIVIRYLPLSKKQVLSTDVVN